MSSGFSCYLRRANGYGLLSLGNCCCCGWL